MTSNWPTDLDADGKAPPNILLVASDDEHLTRQAMYQIQAASQLQDRGFEVESFQTPLVGKTIRITLPIVTSTPDGGRAVIYTQSEDWTMERIEALRFWIAKLREESDIAVIVATRVPVTERTKVPHVTQWLNLPYDTLNTPDAPAPATTAGPLLPCLKEAKWAGRGDTVCRALWEKESSPYMPWVAVGYDHPHTFEFINTTQLAELKTTEKALEEQALAALGARPATWERVSIDVNGTPLTILTCSGDYFSAEHILDTPFLLQAQRLLKAKGLFVGVPRRGLLMATAGPQAEPMVSAFGRAVAGQFSRGETALISPMLFAMTDGVIIGILEDIAEAMVPDGEPMGPPGGPDDEDDEDDPNAPYTSAIVSRNDQGTEDVHFMAGGQDADRLTQAIETGFMSLMKEHAARKEFSGHIRIVVLSITPPAARKPIPKLLEHLRGICNDMSRGKDRRYRVTLTFQTDSFGSTPDAPVAEAPRRSATPAVVAPPEESRPWWIRPRLWLVAIGIAVGAYYAIYGGAFSYPRTLLYNNASLSRAGDWDREGTSGAVFVPAGEVMPTASRQVGVITSTTHGTPAILLGWIVQQSLASPGVHHHDATTNNERCLVGTSQVPGGNRSYLSLQTCKAFDSRAACIELDQAIDLSVVTTCLHESGCFADLCSKGWLQERNHLERALTSVLER